MSLRTRLDVHDLEGRDNPSGPDLLDPFTTGTTTATTTGAGSVLVGIVVTTVTTTTTTTTTDTNPLITLNSIYKTTLLP